MLPGLSAAGVSPVKGCEEGDECGHKEESRLMSIGALCGELGMMVTPGGSASSWFPRWGNSPSASLASRPRIGGCMVRVVALVVAASGGGPPSSAGMRGRPFSSSLLARAASTA